MIAVHALLLLLILKKILACESAEFILANFSSFFEVLLWWSEKDRHISVTSRSSDFDILNAQGVKDLVRQFLKFSIPIFFLLKVSIL